MGNILPAKILALVLLRPIFTLRISAMDNKCLEPYSYLFFSRLKHFNKTIMTDYKFEITGLMIRIFAGILFLFQGYDKLFKIKMKGVIGSFTIVDVG